MLNVSSVIEFSIEDFNRKSIQKHKFDLENNVKTNLMFFQLKLFSEIA